MRRWGKLIPPLVFMGMPLLLPVVVVLSGPKEGELLAASLITAVFLLGGLMWLCQDAPELFARLKMNGKKIPPAQSQNLFGGGIAIMVGLSLVLMSLNIIPTDDDTYHAPRWIVTMIGAMFCLAGLSVTPARCTMTFTKRFAPVGVALIFTGFAILLNWLVFAPHELPGSGVMEFNGLILPIKLPPWSIRAIFLPGAMLLTAAAFLAWREVFWRKD